VLPNDVADAILGDDVDAWRLAALDVEWPEQLTPRPFELDAPLPPGRERRDLAAACVLQESCEVVRRKRSGRRSNVSQPSNVVATAATHR